jgi:hypothetical protein
VLSGKDRNDFRRSTFRSGRPFNNKSGKRFKRFRSVRRRLTVKSERESGEQKRYAPSAMLAVQIQFPFDPMPSRSGERRLGGFSAGLNGNGGC